MHIRDATCLYNPEVNSKLREAPNECIEPSGSENLVCSSQSADDLLADLISVSYRFDDLEVFVFTAFLYTTFSPNEHFIGMASNQPSYQGKSEGGFVLLGTTSQNLTKNGPSLLQ